jgi:hypothetical protein
MRLSLTLALASSLTLCACGRPATEAPPITTSISGKVLDSSNGQAVSGALVATEPFVKQAFTSADGVYTIDTGLTVGTTYRVTASKAGYATNSVNIANIVEGKNTVADLPLTKAGPLLHLSVTSVQINAGDSAGTFRVENNGEVSQALAFNVSNPTASWITGATPNSGSVTSTPSVITVNINRSSLPAGTGNVTSTLDVTSNGGSGTVQISVVR